MKTPRMSGLRKWKFCMLIICFMLGLLSQGNASEDQCLDHEIRIVIIGKTGAGKSATGNSILGGMAFKSENSMESVTRSTSYVTAWRFNRKLVVVDTPGLGDTNLSEGEVITEITKSYTMVSPGPNAFIMVIRSTRFTKEDQRILETFIYLFGEEFTNYLVLVFTDKTEMQKDGGLEVFLKKIPENRPIKKLIRAVRKRYLAIDYSSDFKDQEEDVIKILKMIENMKHVNSPPYFETPLSWYTELLYNLFGYNKDNGCSPDYVRDKSREDIFKLFLKYAQIIAVIVFSAAFFYGYGLPVAIKILQVLIRFASFL